MRIDKLIFFIFYHTTPVKSSTKCLCLGCSSTILTVTITGIKYKIMSKKKTFLNIHPMTRRKSIIAVLVAGVILLALGAGVYYAFVPKEGVPVSEGPDKLSDEDIATTRSNVEKSVNDGELRQKAFEDVNNSNLAAAADTYNAAIAAETSQERKTELAIDLSGVYYAAGEYDKAFEAMKEAEASNPDKFLVSDWLSRLHEDRKDYAQSERYYRLAGEWANSPQNKTGLNKNYYNSEADRVSKLRGTN